MFVCVCGPVTLKSCSNCEVQNSYVVPSFISETMSSTLKRLTSRVLHSSALIHNFLLHPPCVHFGSHFHYVLLGHGFGCGLHLIPATNTAECDLGAGKRQKTKRLKIDMVPLPSIY